MECGTKIGSIPSTSPLFQESEPKPPISQKTNQFAERRQLTVLFCDLVGSTPLSEKLDAEEYRQVILDYHHLAEKVIKRFGGHIAQYLGDGLLVYFGYPIGLENAPRIGVLAGLGIIEAVAKANPIWASEGKTEIDIRLGLHSGLVVVDSHLAVGDTVNIAARLEGLAPINSLVMSSQSSKLVQGWFETKSLGEHFLKGIANAMEVFQVLGESGVKSQIELSVVRGLSPLIGREEEVQTLLAAWNNAKNGRGQLALLNGEAGIGKSRLVERIKKQVQEETYPKKLELRCSAYHVNSPFYPLIDLLDRTLLFEEEEAPEAKLAKLEKWMEEIHIEKNPNLPIFADFLLIPMEEEQKLAFQLSHLSAKGKKKKFSEGFSASFFNFAKKQPLLLIIEDLHWMDISTLEWLESMVEQVHAYPLFILSTARPEFQSSWSGKSYTRQLNLERLSHDRMEAIIKHQTRGKKLPASVLQLIKDKTDGIPLFIEELTRTIIESDILEENEDQYKLRTLDPSGVLDLAIPATLQDSLLARLDKLASVRELVQVGAILGREFSFELLQAVTQKDVEGLENDLRKVVDAELLYQKGVPPKANYQFKHALIQDAAYSTLLKSNRHQWHHKIALVLEEQFPHLSAAQPELLAYHLTEAEVTEKAIEKWQEAGVQNIAGHAMVEATKHLREGIKLLGSIETTQSVRETELNLLLYLGGAIIHHKGYSDSELEEIFSQTYELSKATNKGEQLFLTFVMMLFYYRLRAEYKRASTIAKEALELAEKENNNTMKVWALNESGSINFLLGNGQDAMELIQKADKIFDREAYSFLGAYGYPRVDIYTLMFYSMFSLTAGYPEKSLRLANKCLKIAESQKVPSAIHLAVNVLIIHYGFTGEWELVKKYSKQMISLAKENRDVYWEMAGELYLNMGLSRTGNSSAPKVSFDINQQFRAIKQHSYQLLFLTFITEAFLSFQQMDKAEECLALAFEHIEQTGEAYCKPDIFRLKGELILQKEKNHQEAEKYFQLAINQAQEQSAKWPELLAAKSLAQLWQSQGKITQAHDLLHGVYNWFTEGLDTIPIKEAAILLTKLQKS